MQTPIKDYVERRTVAQYVVDMYVHGVDMWQKLYNGISNPALTDPREVRAMVQEASKSLTQENVKFLAKKAYLTLAMSVFFKSASQDFWTDENTSSELRTTIMHLIKLMNEEVQLEFFLTLLESIDLAMKHPKGAPEDGMEMIHTVMTTIKFAQECKYVLSDREQALYDSISKALPAFRMALDETVE